VQCQRRDRHAKTKLVGLSVFRIPQNTDHAHHELAGRYETATPPEINHALE
jgi:hypothetical protein